MKRLAALFLCALFVVCAPAFAEDAALTKPSGEFDPATAWYMLSRFMGQSAEDTAAAVTGAGFEVVRQANYDKPETDHSHTSAYTLGLGEMDVRGQTRNVFLITVRGTAAGEWQSNFDFAFALKGECEYAENFMAAARAIYAEIKPDLDAADSPVIVATGYSRGAACANLLGVLLNADFDPEDIYVYTFATPNTVRTADVDYANIFNIVNEKDCVTRMPLSQWGFRRAGTDITLCDEALDNSAMDAMFLELLGVCPDIDSYYGADYDGTTLYGLFQGMSGMFTGAADAGMQTMMAGIMKSDSPLKPFLSAFMSYSGLMSGDAKSMLTTGMFAQHMPTVYIKLMKEAFGN